MALSGELRSFERTLQHRQDQSQHSTSSTRSSAFEEVEQGREVAFEIQEEREVQRPCLPVFKFPGLHQAIREFVTTGLLNGNSGYTRASTALAMTHLG